MTQTIHEIVADISKVHAVDKNTKHSYIETYERLFRERRNQSITIVEAGVASGESILMWSRYFSNAKIIGLDLDTSEFMHDRSENIFLYDGNVTDTAFVVDKVKNGIDIFIDDASHKSNDMLQTFEIVKKFMNKNGLYVIEDIPSDSVVNFLSDSIKDYKTEIVDLRRIKGRYDDIMLVVYFT
jgi:cephalosporin hydroxylase